MAKQNQLVLAVIIFVILIAAAGAFNVTTFSIMEGDPITDIPSVDWNIIVITAIVSGLTAGIAGRATRR